MKHKLLRWLALTVFLSCILVSSYPFIGWQIPLQQTQGNFPLNEKWSYTSDAMVETVSLTSNNVTIIQTSASLVALSSTGTLLWKQPFQDEVDPAPAQSDNGVVFVSNKKGVWAFDEQTGIIVWNSSLPRPTESRIQSLTKCCAIVSTISDSITAYQLSDGRIRWSVPDGRAFATAQVEDDAVYVIHNGIQALDESTGAILWTQGQNSTTSSAYKNGFLYYNDGDLHIIAFNTHEKYMAWVSELPNGLVNEVTVLGTHVLVVSISDFYLLKTQTGEIIWQAHVRGNNALAMDGTVYLADMYGQRITAFDEATGKQLGSVSFGLPWTLLHFTDTMDARNGLLVVGFGKSVHAYAKP